MPAGTIVEGGHRASRRFDGDGSSRREDHDLKQRDLRDTELWQWIERYFTQLHAPAFGTVAGASEPCAAPDGRRIAFIGSEWDKLDGHPDTRICVADVVAWFDQHMPPWCRRSRRVR